MRAERKRWLRNGLLAAVLLLLGAAASVAALIYVPLYEDRQLRSEVDAAMRVVADVQRSASEYIRRTRSFPPDLATVQVPTHMAEGPVSGVAITDAGIELTLRSDSDKLAGRTLILDARLNDDGSVAWSCGAGTLDRRYQPDSCHSAFFK